MDSDCSLVRGTRTFHPKSGRDSNQLIVWRRSTVGPTTARAGVGADSTAAVASSRVVTAVLCRTEVPWPVTATGVPRRGRPPGARPVRQRAPGAAEDDDRGAWIQAGGVDGGRAPLVPPAWAITWTAEDSAVVSGTPA